MENDPIIVNFIAKRTLKETLATYYRVWLTLEHPKEFEAFKNSVDTISEASKTQINTSI